jgi:uncharacterized protein (DUF1499 family)
VARRNPAVTTVRKKMLFREVNERVVEVSRQAVEGDIEILCECGEDPCLAQITLSASAYDAVRTVPTRFVVAPGHENEKLERVVTARPGYVVVEKAHDAAAYTSLLTGRRAG